MELTQKQEIQWIRVSFVLSKFTNDEEKRLIELEPIVNNIINDYANKNFDLVMNKYNHRK